MWALRLALDATYSADRNPTGVGVYSREILHGLAHAHPEARWLWCYRPHRLLRSLRHKLPPGCARRPLGESYVPRSDLFHGLNQRLPDTRLGRAVATFHDLFVLTGDYSTPEFRERFARQAKQAAQRADLLIAVSEFTASQLRDVLGAPTPGIRVIHHGVRVPSIEGHIEREPMVLCTGAIQRRKNTVRLIEAFEAMPLDWRLVLAGSLGYGAEEALERIASSPRRESITLTGYVDAQTLHSLYRRASIFAFPSLDEGFGMPVLDAMSYQVPVLTSNRSALPEVAGDAALLVDPYSVEEIASGLTRLAEDPALRESLASRGSTRVTQFRWEDAVERTWQVYKELLNEV
jgi:glycosyltransferase involved in cell wall biosynthesis